MTEQKNEKHVCCSNGRFPTLPIILLVVGVLWFLDELQVLGFNIPWLPIILIVFALGWMINHDKSIK